MMKRFFLWFASLSMLSFLLTKQTASQDGTEDNFEEFLDFVEELVRNQSIEFNISLPILTCSENYKHDLEFNCPAYPSKEVPTSVHKLKPADINVVAALGDSLTAAFGADSCTLASLAQEFRGRSWSVGGKETLDEIFTLPNIIKNYNPHVKGYSIGRGDEESNGANMNVAFVGARAEHMPLQAQKLITKMKSDLRIDIENDWKLVTIFIGGNDLCLACRNVHKYAAEQYTYYLQETLDLLYRELPRCFVNVIGILQVSELEHFDDIVCKSIHFFACPCLFRPDNMALVKEVTRKYQNLTEALIMSGRYDTRDDFSVVYQPFLDRSLVPRQSDGRVDKSYFAPDCFHFSSKGHALGAKELWNNMLTPVGRKNRSYEPSGFVICPSDEYPYLATRLNSSSEILKATHSAIVSVLAVGRLCLLFKEIQ